MRQPEWLKAGIALGNQFHYKRVNPLVHNFMNLGLLALMLSACLGLVSLSLVLPVWAYIPLAGFGLGVLFFSLVILVIHEASHGMFLVMKDRQKSLFWNRLFGWTISVPFAINYHKHWEEGHQRHHLHPVEPGDPQSANLFTGKAFIREVLLMLLVPGYVFIWNPNRKYKTHRWLPAANLLFWVITIWATVSVFPWWAALGYLGGFQVVGALNQLKGSLEHGGEIATEENRNLRSRTSLFLLRPLIMPLNISIHFEHHLNYCVPWYKLMDYHRVLRPLVPEVAQPLIFNTQIWDQVMGRLGRFPESLRGLLYIDLEANGAESDEYIESA